MSEQKIADIREALEKVTQGRWVACAWDPMEKPHVFASEKQGHTCNGKADMPLTANDADFIANSPEYIRFLLSELDRERKLKVHFRAKKDESREENRKLQEELNRAVKEIEHQVKRNDKYREKNHKLLGERDESRRKAEEAWKEIDVLEEQLQSAQQDKEKLNKALMETLHELWLTGSTFKPRIEGVTE